MVGPICSWLVVSLESFPLSTNQKESILKWAKFFEGTLAKLSLPLFHIRPGKEAIFVDQRSSMKQVYVFLLNSQSGKFTPKFKSEGLHIEVGQIFRRNLS